MKLGFREGVAGALIAVVLVAGWMLVFKPRNEINQKLEAKATELDRSVKAVNTVSATMEDVKREIDEIEGAMTFFKSRLPSERDVDKIHAQISKLALKNELKFKSFSPTKDNARLRYVPPGSPYDELAMKIELEGDFRKVYSFLQDLENRPRITRVRELKLTLPRKHAAVKRDGTELSVERAGIVECEIVMCIFFERDTAPTVLPKARK